MNTWPTKKLAVEGSIRQRSAREAIVLRYVGFYASVTVLIASTWTLVAAPLALASCALGAPALAALFRPWHRALHVEMDSPELRMHVELLGFLPLARREIDLTGKQLTLDRRAWLVEAAQGDDSGVGCLAFVLPFPISLLLKLGSDSTKAPRTVSQCVLCTRDRNTGNTEHLLLLQDSHVAVPFLDAVREVLPDHVGQA